MYYVLNVIGILLMSLVMSVMTACTKTETQVCEEETYIKQVGWHRMHSRDCNNYDYHQGIRNTFGKKWYDVWSYPEEILKCDPDFFKKFKNGDLISSNDFTFNYLFGGCREEPDEIAGCVILEFVEGTKNNCWYE